MKNYRNFYRASVGIALLNFQGKLWAGRRSENDQYWQMPQGGIEKNENTEQAFYREIKEELGLLPENLKIIKIHDKWLYYDLPSKFFWLKEGSDRDRCVGQKQKWILCGLIDNDNCININQHSMAEFMDWHWKDPQLLPTLVIDFKKKLYHELIVYFMPWIKNYEESIIYDHKEQ